jgi:hypothetical protein
MTVPTHLSALEEVLKDIRGGGLNPVTKIWWDMHFEINLELANKIKVIVFIVGLGYMGFPRAVELSKQTSRKLFMVTEVCK